MVFSTGLWCYLVPRGTDGSRLQRRRWKLPLRAALVPSLRVFKLARSWTQLNQIITTMFKSLASISYLSLILLLFMFIFALGMQLFECEFIFCDGQVDAANAECPAGFNGICPMHFDCYAPCSASEVDQWVTFLDAGVGNVQEVLW